jgi:uncharacterized radical SAM superfamily protein
MAQKEKHHVFSARTTGEGLKELNEVKARLNVGWDELVIDAVCAHYGLDKAAMSPPKKEKLAKVLQTAEQQAPVKTGSESLPAEEKTKIKSK